MAEKRKQPVRGMEGVVAAQTHLSFVDGQNGKLYYRGYDIDELAGKTTYEEVVYLLWLGRLPNSEELEDFSSEIVSDMRLPGQIEELLRMSPPKANPMVVLRTAVSALGMFDPDGGKNSDAANLRKAKRILAQVATIVASLYRVRAGLAPLSADANMTLAENFVYLFNGKRPNKLEREVIDSTLMFHADHGLAASTFAARVTVSTHAGMHSALTSALATLKGPLHGGANRKVMEMLEDIGGPERVNAYINGMVASGQRIMGFGHRVYKTEDPRSKHLRRYAEQLCKKTKAKNLLDISHRIEKLVLEKKGINPNVDFYSGMVQEALGIPKEFYTCVFAVARTAGWIAHIMEQFRDNRLIRPTSNYIGGFGKKFVPLNKR